MQQTMLFDIGGPRAFHESESQQQVALAILRVRPLTKLSFEADMANGSRLAPAIEILRNGWGFDISGAGTSKLPYQLERKTQSPTKVHDNKIKPLYYASEHWRQTREKRYAYDNYRCVLCVGPCVDLLECHHIKYDLFAESQDNLMTVCRAHHEVIHENCAMSFPIGVELWMAESLLEVIAYPFAEWLLP